MDQHLITWSSFILIELSWFYTAKMKYKCLELITSMSICRSTFSHWLLVSITFFPSLWVLWNICRSTMLAFWEDLYSLLYICMTWGLNLQKCALQEGGELIINVLKWSCMEETTCSSMSVSWFPKCIFNSYQSQNKGGIAATRYVCFFCLRFRNLYNFTLQFFLLCLNYSDMIYFPQWRRVVGTADEESREKTMHRRRGRSKPVQAWPKVGALIIRLIGTWTNSRASL
jgi:hypothetical protein